NSTRCFFFSSRRRHTRWPRDWSSDVCSSDLGKRIKTPELSVLGGTFGAFVVGLKESQSTLRTKFRKTSRVYQSSPKPFGLASRRSEERRVGKECRCKSGRETSKERVSIDCSS